MEKILAGMIIEILGRPPEHVKEALSSLVDKLGAEKGVKIIERNLHEPIPAEGSENLFTTFAELQIEFDSIENFLGVIFAYMPANAEIIKPEKITLTNVQLTDLGNVLIQRLHSYEAIAKGVLSERQIILEELKKSSPELYKKLSTPPVQSQEKIKLAKPIKKKKN